MAEVIGILTGVTATIQQSIILFQSIRSALNSRKNIHDFINQHYLEAKRTSQLIEVVIKEESLRTPPVISAIQDVNEAGKRLNARLEAAKKSLKKSDIKLVGNALFPDPEEDKKLQAELKELELAKENLNSYILLHNVGLTRDINNSIKVQTISIDKLNRAVKEVLGTSKPLQLEKMAPEREETDKDDVPSDEEYVDAMDIDANLDSINNGSSIANSIETSGMESSTIASSTSPTLPNSQGTVGNWISSKEECEDAMEQDGSDPRIRYASIASSSRNPTPETASTRSSMVSSVANPTRATKKIERNESKYDSMMINAPAAETDNWKGDNVTIKRNKSGNSSTMINYPSSESFMLRLAKIRSINREPQSGGPSLFRRS